MSKSCAMVSLFLMALLAFTPVLRGYAAVPSHSGHVNQDTTQHMDHHSTSHHGSVAHPTSGKSVCAQHDFCNGLCCASCAQSFSIIAYLPALEDARLSVLMPIVPRLISTIFTTLRERPPRTTCL